MIFPRIMKLAASSGVGEIMVVVILQLEVSEHPKRKH
jgi:hypothetical protein